MMRRISCLLERLCLGILQRVYGFDPWHSKATYACRPYKSSVVRLANSLPLDTVVEIGCGLGDIVSRVKARHRVGIDLAPQVIRAARFLHPRGIVWMSGSAAALDQQLSVGSVIDCLIMVNWIHNLSAEELKAILAPLLPRTRYLIMDAIDPDAQGSYRFRHDFSFLAGYITQLAAIRVPAEPRSFLLFRASASNEI
jgi:hypothetical protein